jgi:hypothetical protein
MAWQQLGGAQTGGNNVPIDLNVHWLGTRNAAPLIIRTENGPLGPGNAPNPAAEVMRITPADPTVLGGAQARSVGIGTGTPQRRLHVEPTEIHSGGNGAGLSFGNRQTAEFVETPGNGERWVWYATGGQARLWSGTDKLAVLPNGNLDVTGNILASTGVSGISSSGSGVEGHSSTGAGVFGFSSADVGVSGFGPRSGVSALSEGTAVAGSGAAGSANSIGVSGIGEARGVFGLGAKGGTGVFGQSATGYAGFFEGKVRVTGILEKPGGGFRIDHPLAPADKFLSHSFVESPEMTNVYDGVVVLDERGAAWIELPQWFGELNRDYRYQLTAIGASAPELHIAEEISDNRFEVAGGAPGMKVSWQVTGIRKDRWAEANRIVIEEEKPAEERGRYLHPQHYGQPEESGISRAPRQEEQLQEQRRHMEERRRQIEEVRRQAEEQEPEA